MSGFSENDIRPDALRAEQAALFAADVAELLQDSAEFVGVACPACGGDTSSVQFVKAGFTYRRCAGCRTVFTSPRPTPERLERYYKTSRNYEFWSRRIFPSSESMRAERIVKPRVDALERLCEAHRVGTDRLIEVGAGAGTFCAEIMRRNRFANVLAVEPTPGLAEACRARGVPVAEVPLEKVAGTLPEADVVVSFETIEHVFDPSVFVDACRSLLRPGGLLMLSCPNVEGFDVAVMGPVADTFDAEHLNYFHPESLSHLLRRRGFSIVETSTPGRLDAELVRKKVLAGQFSLAGQPFLETVLLRNWERHGESFQDFLSANGLSSHMVVVARRSPE